MCTHCAAQHGHQLKEAQHKPVEPLPTLPLPLPDTHCGENPPSPLPTDVRIREEACSSFQCTALYLHYTAFISIVVLNSSGLSCGTNPFAADFAGSREETVSGQGLKLSLVREKIIFGQEWK